MAPERRAIERRNARNARMRLPYSLPDPERAEGDGTSTASPISRRTGVLSALAPPTLDLDGRVRREWQACASEHGFQPYLATGPSLSHVDSYLRYLISHCKGRISSTGLVTARFLERRMRHLVWLLKAECAKWEYSPYTRQEFRELTDAVIAEKDLHDGHRVKYSLGPNEALRLIRRMIDGGAEPSGCMEQALQQACLVSLILVSAVRCGSIAVSRYYPTDCCLTLADIELSFLDVPPTLPRVQRGRRRDEDGAGPLIRLDLTIRYAKGKMKRETREHPDKIPLYATDNPKYFDTCPVLRVLALLFYRGAFRDFTTPHDLLTARNTTQKIFLKPSMLSHPLILAAEKPCGGPMVTICRPDDPDLKHPTDAAMTADGAQRYYRRIADACGYPRSMTLHSARHNAARTLASRYGIEVAQAALGHAPNSRVARTYYAGIPDIDRAGVQFNTDAQPSHLFLTDERRYGDWHRNTGPIRRKLSRTELASITGPQRKSERLKRLRELREEERQEAVDNRLRAGSEEAEEEAEQHRPQTRLEWLEWMLSEERWSSPDLFVCEICNPEECHRMSPFEKPFLMPWRDLVYHTKKVHRLLLPSKPSVEGPYGHYGMVAVTPSPSPSPSPSPLQSSSRSRSPSRSPNENDFAMDERQGFSYPPSPSMMVISDDEMEDDMESNLGLPPPSTPSHTRLSSRAPTPFASDDNVDVRPTSGSQPSMTATHSFSIMDGTTPRDEELAEEDAEPVAEKRRGCLIM